MAIIKVFISSAGSTPKDACGTIKQRICRWHIEEIWEVILKAL